ncbi:MAG: DNA gyrase subunit A [Bacilli bacterium]|nr:DNA gyrase subunit A [Bacilli bacterium]
MFYEDEENKEVIEEEQEETVNEEALDEVEAGIVPGLQDVSTVELVKSSFLDYAMSVIVSRAIPDARDGLKPVHRRIIYGMHESGMTPDKPHKKSARIVGDVMGKYHPHGDSAIYQTLVRLAQPFSMRHTLVDGHGNFGSMDGDEAAAMRYTEARMTKIALEMVRDINCDVVDFVDNYDGSEQEPSVLPSRFPNLLVNGSSGIAVGMATNIPPHNLGEVIDGVIAIARNPQITNVELMDYIKGPDFPTGAIILGRNGIRDAYETGTGSIAIRSRCHIEERGEHGALKRIVVDEVPYQVNKATMVENIVALARDKVIDGITEVRDESNNLGVRVVIEVRRDIIPEVLLNQLYKNTQLQTSYGIIMLCLVDNAPKVAPLNVMLQSYLDYQVEIIERRTKFLLAKDEERHHIVLGLIKCHDNIDEIVDIIKASQTPEDATKTLMEKFGFTEVQVGAILAMTLRRLTGIETDKLEAEKLQLEDNIKEYNRILSTRENEIEVVIEELTEIKEKFADERRTEISNELASIDDEDLIPQENIVVAITRGGYVKRLTSDSFKAQHRGGRGVRGMSTNEDDIVDNMVYTKTHTDLLFFTDFGKVYRIRGYQIPEFSKASKGVPVINLINIEKGENVKSIITCDEYTEGKYLMFFTKMGVVKKTKIEEYASIRQNGKIAIDLREGDSLLEVKQVDDESIIGIAGNNAKICNFDATQVRPMGRTASGVKGIDLTEEEFVVGITSSSEGDHILAMTSKGFGKLTDFYERDENGEILVDENGEKQTVYRKTKRGAKGVTTLKANEKVGDLIAVKTVNLEDDLMCITNAGIVIRTPLAQIRVCGRNTSGVKVMNLEGRQRIVSIAIVPHEEPSEEEFPEEGEEVEAEAMSDASTDTALEPNNDEE